jgi:hypothetical protein
MYSPLHKNLSTMQERRYESMKEVRETYYWKCPYCGANLDPGESCDCKKEAVDDYKSVQGGEKKDVQKGFEE